MPNQAQNLSQNSDLDQNQNKNQGQPPEKERFLFMTLKTHVIVLIFTVFIAIIIGGGYMIAKYAIIPPSNIDLPIVKPIVEAQCEIDSDCKLLYVGFRACAPCDFSVVDYKCFNKDEAKKGSYAIYGFKIK